MPAGWRQRLTAGWGECPVQMATHAYLGGYPGARQGTHLVTGIGFQEQGGQLHRKQGARRQLVGQQAGQGTRQPALPVHQHRRVHIPRQCWLRLLYTPTAATLQVTKLETVKAGATLLQNKLKPGRRPRVKVSKIEQKQEQARRFQADKPTKIISLIHVDSDLDIQNKFMDS